MSVTLNGSLSSSSLLVINPPPQQSQLLDIPVTYSWSSNCPGAAFDSATKASPKMVFNALSSQNLPTSCSVSLTVSNIYGQSASCSASVAVDNCNVDCKGVPNGGAVIDECGECDGDGQSCLGCTDKSQLVTLFAMDGRAAAQAKIVKAVGTKILREKRASRKTKALAISLMIEAEKLYNSNWATTWTLPKVVSTCTNTQLCSTVDFSPFVAEYERNSDRLLQILLRLVKEYQLAARNKSAGAKELASGIKTRKLIAGDIKTVSKVSSVCATRK